VLFCLVFVVVVFMVMSRQQRRFEDRRKLILDSAHANQSLADLCSYRFQILCFDVEHELTAEKHLLETLHVLIGDRR